MTGPNYMVYVFIDPRDMRPFYVGMTCRPAQRWSGHHSDRASVARLRLHELRALELKCRVRIVRLGLPVEEARQLERETIARHRASVLNKDTRIDSEQRASATQAAAE